MKHTPGRIYQLIDSLISSSRKKILDMVFAIAIATGIKPQTLAESMNNDKMLDYIDEFLEALNAVKAQETKTKLEEAQKAIEGDGFKIRRLKK